MREQDNSTAEPRVLVISATVGAGHNSVARSLIDRFQRRLPHAEVKFVDVLDYTSRLFRLYYAGGFELGMTALPWAYGLGYRLMNHPQGTRRGLLERYRLWTERIATRHIRPMVRQYDPHVMVHTHFLTPPVIDWMNRTGRLDVPQYVVVTDYEVHRFWYSSGVRRWFLPAEYSGEAFRRWGIDDDELTVSGIPVHAKWTSHVDRQRVLDDWSLPEDRPIVLLSGGTEFTCGPIVETARKIAASCDGAYVVVLAGRNKDLLGKLSQLEEVPSRILPVAFTDRLHELSEVASLFVTKPGGITTTECLARRTPMVLTNPVPGQEGGNAEFFQRQGAAVIARGQQQIVSAAKFLLNQPDQLDRMADKAGELYRPGTETVVNTICDECSLD